MVQTQGWGWGWLWGNGVLVLVLEFGVRDDNAIEPGASCDCGNCGDGG